MNCNQCGKSLREGARFCPDCGAKQGVGQAEPKPASQEQPAAQPANKADTDETTYTRFTRSEYWLGTLILSAIALIAGWLGGVFGFFVALLICVFQIGVSIGRLHDRGKSGHYLWWALLPLVGWIMIFVELGCMPSDGDNMYGPGPTPKK